MFFFSNQYNVFCDVLSFYHIFIWFQRGKDKKILRRYESWPPYDVDDRRFCHKQPWPSAAPQFSSIIYSSNTCHDMTIQTSFVIISPSPQHNKNKFQFWSWNIILSWPRGKYTIFTHISPISQTVTSIQAKAATLLSQTNFCHMFVQHQTTTANTHHHH